MPAAPSGSCSRHRSPVLQRGLLLAPAGIPGTPGAMPGQEATGGAALRGGRYEKRHCPPEQSQLSYLSMKGISMEGAVIRGDLWPPYGFDL